jgi:hypothetical protein
LSNIQLKLHLSKIKMLRNKMILMSRFCEVIIRTNLIKHHNSQGLTFSLMVRFPCTRKPLNMHRNLMTEWKKYQQCFKERLLFYFYFTPVNGYIFNYTNSPFVYCAIFVWCVTAKLYNILRWQQKYSASRREATSASSTLLVAAASALCFGLAPIVSSDLTITAWRWYWGAESQWRLASKDT